MAKKNLNLKLFLFIILISIFFNFQIISGEIDLGKEYSLDEFQNGVRAFHDAEYEQAITYFIKSLGHDDNNHLARYFLGESYRKAGYEKNAIFTWNSLLALGYDDSHLRSRIAYLYNRRGILSEININKTYLLKEDIKGYYDKNTPPRFLKPSQIAIDSNNHYYIASFMTGMVLELDPNFNIIKNHFTLVQKLEKPFGIVVDKEGYLYVSDFQNDVVLKFDKLGVIQTKIGFKGIGKGGLLGPEYLLFDDDENLYVVDSGNHRINKYKKDGDILFSFGDQDGDGKLNQPAGLYYSNNKIYVCDKGGNRIVVFDKNGNYLFSFGEDKLVKPNSIVIDGYNRFLILCEKEIWAYEEENGLWYIIDAPGNRLEKGISIAVDKESNLLISDFNTSRLLVLTQEVERYTNLNVNIERVFSNKFPDVYISLSVEKEDFSVPTGINERNITVYENGKMVPIIGTDYTKQRDLNTDILVLYDKNLLMSGHKKDFRILMDNWLKNIKDTTEVGFISLHGEDPVLENNFKSTRLSILDSIDNGNFERYTDKGAGIKFGIYHMLSRFSKKSIIIVTNSGETGNDFNQFSLEDCISLAINNDISIYVVSFGDGGLSQVYNYISKKTGGDYYRVYKRNDILYLLKKIEESKGREIVVNYTSGSFSRFGDEPITVSVEINYGGMIGISKSVYYPANREFFYNKVNPEDKKKK